MNMYIYIKYNNIIYIYIYIYIYIVCFGLDTVQDTFAQQKLLETVVLPMQSRNQP